MARLGYSALLWALFPVILLRLWWRSRRQPEYLEHLGERFGNYRLRPSKPVIWLHAVSVGETRAAAPLIGELCRAYPDHQILLTHMTPTGRETGVSLYGERVLRCYLPYDYRFAVRKFLRHFSPSLGILMETEIWFNLIDECHSMQIPLWLVNARLSEKSFRGYFRFASLAGSSLRQLSGILAQTESDRARLLRLGATSVAVSGNLKFDVSPSPDALVLGRKFRQGYGDRFVFLCASTRDGEEQLILDAVASLEIPGLLIVIVPRHPQRFAEVEDGLRGRGLSYQKRSENAPIREQTRVLLGDSMGEMFAYYQACDVAFIGGSLKPLGGQNLIEACSVGIPVLVGPHTFNFQEATDAAVDCGAALRVANAAELVAEVAELALNPSRRQAMSQAALEFAGKNRGAVSRVMQAVQMRQPLI